MRVPPPLTTTTTPTALEHVWDSIVTPGAGPGLLWTINVAGVSLILFALYCCSTYVYTIHLPILAALCLCLLAGVNWLAAVGGSDATGAKVEEGSRKKEE